MEFSKEVAEEGGGEATEKGDRESEALRFWPMVVEFLARYSYTEGRKGAIDSRSMKMAQWTGRFWGRGKHEST